MYNANQVEDKLHKLNISCLTHKDKLSLLVLYSVSNYIVTDKAPRDFVENFISFPDARIDDLITKCLSGDRSSDGIIKTCRKIFKT